jgi:mannitol-1-phosphate/altronate dehydrogenase
MACLRAAFLEESGETLIRRHAGVDRLFTAQGYREFADDLLARMFNPWLGDLVSRVGRDPQRKLGWDDRLAGTVRVAMAHGVRARRYGAGAAAAVAMLDPATLETGCAAALERLWSEAKPAAEEARAVIEVVEEGRRLLRQWIAGGFPHLESLFAGC